MSGGLRLTPEQLAAITKRLKPRTVKLMAADVENVRGGRPKKARTPEQARAAKLKYNEARKARLAKDTVYKTSDGEALLIQQMTLAGIADWEREYRFHPERKWRLDFAWPEVRLAVEVEGGTWQNGRHNRGSGFRKDAEKYNFLALANWRLLRYTPDMLKTGGAVQQITDMLCGLQMIGEKR